MNRKVIVIGAGGHGKVIADIAVQCGDHVIGFLDDEKISSETVAGIPVLGQTSDFVKYDDAEFIIAIGNSGVRQNLSERLAGVRWSTAVHPRAVISPLNVQIGSGSAVMANAVINPCAKIGRHCIINTSAVVEHDNVIEDYVHISVGAKLGGTVLVGTHTWIGIGSTVSNNVAICAHCILGAGAVAIHDIKESGTYVGIPAKKIK